MLFLPGVFSVLSGRDFSGSDHFARCDFPSLLTAPVANSILCQTGRHFLLTTRAGGAVMCLTGTYSPQPYTDGGMFWSTHLSLRGHVRANLSLKLSVRRMLRNACLKPLYVTVFQQLAWLAQSAERETLNLKVAGSTPASGFLFAFFFFPLFLLRLVAVESDLWFLKIFGGSCGGVVRRV